VLVASRNSGLAVGATAGLFASLPVGLAFGLTEGLSAGLLIGLFFVLVIGLMFGLDAWLYHYWLRWRLRARAFLPARLPTFLEWCARDERGWLRITDAYEFRHRELLEHLAPTQHVYTHAARGRTLPRRVRRSDPSNACVSDAIAPAPQESKWFIMARAAK
jgi:hypothetical protein